MSRWRSIFWGLLLECLGKLELAKPADECREAVAISKCHLTGAFTGSEAWACLTWECMCAGAVCV